MIICQSYSYRKDLRWIHFDKEPRVQERQQVEDQHFCISVFAAYRTIPSSNQGHQPRRVAVFHAWWHGRSIEIQNNLRRQKLHRTNQGSNFLGGSFSNQGVSQKIKTDDVFSKSGIRLAFTIGCHHSWRQEKSPRINVFFFIINLIEISNRNKQADWFWLDKSSK